ncbi:MAG: SUMF1/EgtB/PvdO family nonheme iron enzyme [Labilithrix sp.]|nr:SUMF1/EgtB/PvdO family nonheme iron enzyme [Labilithrix sp.]MCW5813448.1 SUMF1/EgtB/PvdO family nonheme iron enzyme [Labilithrix sp.]
MRGVLRTGLFIVAASFAAGGVALAQNPDEAPASCRAQVVNALSRLAPAFAGKTRKIAAKQPGSLEAAIWGYAPPKYHDVEEGTLPPPRAGGKCPSEMAFVAGRVCVDKWEGHIVLRAPDGAETPHSPYVPPPSDKVYVAKSAPNVVPQGYISAKQSETACKAAGKRLCHPVEWRVACGGTEGTAFPYGPTRVTGKCHDTGKSPMVTYHAGTMNRGWGQAELNDPRNNQLEGGLAKTGAYPDCVTDEGVFDMVGNLSEWTADPNGTFQGGLWLDTTQHGEGCAYRTISHEFQYHDYSTGFRCCADPTGG